MDSTIEITSRFRAMLRRIGTLQGPYVGVPLAPGEVPFVARRELIAQVVRNLVDIKATFVDDGDTTYLQIEGRTAIGRHISKVRNLQNTLNERQIEREAYRWAKNCRDALKKATRKGVVFDKAAREVRKIEVKRRKVDEQIQKLERKVNDRRSSRPVNPLPASTRNGPNAAPSRNWRHAMPDTGRPGSRPRPQSRQLWWQTPSRPSSEASRSRWRFPVQRRFGSILHGSRTTQASKCAESGFPTPTTN